MFLNKTENGLRVFDGKLAEGPTDGFSNEEASTFSGLGVFVYFINPRFVELAFCQLEKEFGTATTSGTKKEELGEKSASPDPKVVVFDPFV